MPLLPSSPEPDALDVSPVLELDRAAVEAALPREVRDALPALAAVWYVRRDRWPDHPLLVDLVSLTAVAALQDRESAKGRSRTQALRNACGRLGLQYERVERRLRRARMAYLTAGESRTKCPPTSLPGARTSEQEGTQKRQAR